MSPRGQRSWGGQSGYSREQGPDQALTNVAVGAITDTGNTRDHHMGRMGFQRCMSLTVRTPTRPPATGGGGESFKFKNTNVTRHHTYPHRHTHGAVRTVELQVMGSLAQVRPTSPDSKPPVTLP